MWPGRCRPIWRVAALLRGRVLGAHNARFDYGFFAHEFAGARSTAPAERRLCTPALNRQVAPATPNLKLGTPAGHYGVRQKRAHDALDDALVLSGILRGFRLAAEHLGLALPLLARRPPGGTSRTSRKRRAPSVVRDG
ncbi:exonuclease domain-containing protein [Streptomyces sp. NPDC051546]|uniref:exonuclease domain-containing protein n=1 Tax=Streptomyces sp. NPDC051546 TaxID=3365655 RepID=UPI0037A1DDE3